MKTRSFWIVLAVYVLIYCNGVCGKNLDIIFPKGEKLELDQEYLPVIGKYTGSDKELKLMLNNSSINTIKLEKGNIFTDKIKLNSGVNELKIVNGAETQTINILYEKEKKNTQSDYVKVLIHAPILDNECSECHTKELKDKYPSVDVSKVICFNCHDSFEKNKFVHGPIGSGACTACHDPHGSIEVRFLRENKNKICYMCHEEESITEHLANLKNSNKEECSYCHDSHGGKDKFFLKEIK
ncbi:MAG: cytochrome c3 family protein [bacterium]|nr:cytochrome c3 family protein [bacterium]